MDFRSSAVAEAPLVRESSVKLDIVSEEKVRSIVEVCNVSRDEAVRVLDACHMDETMAIERFLSGKEVSAWSQVSKKKKPVSRASSRGIPRDRRERDRKSPHFSADSGKSNSGPKRVTRSYQQRNNETLTVAKRAQSVDVSDFREPCVVPRGVDTMSLLEAVVTSTETSEKGPDDAVERGIRTSSEKISVSHAPASNGNMWQEHQKIHLAASETVGNSWPESPQPVASASVWKVRKPSSDSVEGQNLHAGHHPVAMKETPEQNERSSPALSRTFNYAAAAAVGTSHARVGPIALEPHKSVSIGDLSVALSSEKNVMGPTIGAETGIPLGQCKDSNMRRSRGGQKPSVREDVESCSDVSHGTSVDGHLHSPGGRMVEASDVCGTKVAPSEHENHPEASAPPSTWPGPSAMQAHPVTRHRTESTSGLTSKPASGTIVTKQEGNSLNLQFGSFGLSGLDGVNWSASDRKAPEPVPTVVARETVSCPDGSNVPVLLANTSMAGGNENISDEVSSTSNVAGERQGSVPMDGRLNASSAVSLASLSLGSSGSGLFPILPVGPAASFPPNYGAPYLIPQLHGYSPGLGAFENGGDLGGSRASNIGPPGSLPLYEPVAMSTMAPGNAKLAGIPGLGEMPGRSPVPSGMSKDSVRTNSHMDKGSPLGSSSLPAGMDSLAAPYMVPGYPSVQYPMYAFPNAPFPAPPGMAPPGPNTFPYPGGQGPSQGSRGGFGFEDVSVNLAGSSRSGTGLGESMYTPGGYLNSMTGSGSHKTTGEFPYKQLGGSAHMGNNLGAVGIAGGVVHGMSYGDYSGGIGSAANAVANAGVSGGWTNARQTNDRNGNGAVANGPGPASHIHSGGSQNSALYAGGPGGSAGGYWTQQGGYYP